MPQASHIGHDVSESAGIRATLGDKAATIPVLATKGALGNSGAGSGAIDLAVTIMALQRGVIPPSLNTDKIDPACGLNVVRGDPKDCRANVAVSVAGALSGGQTAALVVRRYHE
jgi:3-oxoacyl-(acyl-carrier-protein) synthase